MQTTTQRPPRDELVRAIVGELELRDDGDDTTPTMTGHFARFNEWTEINSVFEGNFMERVAPGAFRKTFNESRDRMRVLFQHGQDPQIGDKPLGSIDVLKEDRDGAYYEVPLLDAPYVRDGILPGLRAGLYGSSFRFSVQREEFNRDAKPSDYNPLGLPERTLKEVAVREFGPVTFPAYAGATASVRSLTDDYMLARYRDAAMSVDRMDAEDLSTLAQMIQLGTVYIAEQDDPGDEVNVPVMQEILARLAELVPYEINEDEPAEPDDRSAPSNGAARMGTPARNAAQTAATWPQAPPDIWEDDVWTR